MAKRHSRWWYNSLEKFFGRPAVLALPETIRFRPRGEGLEERAVFSVAVPLPTITTTLIDIFPGADSGYPNRLTNVNGTLFFAANDPSDHAHGYELWKSDGTVAGTTLVKDILPGPSTSNVQWLTNLNGTLFFAANDGTHGFELWKSDGTEAGTVLVKDIYPGSGDGRPTSLANVNGTLFFSARDPATGYELWKSDGTLGGTVLVKDLSSGDSSPNGLFNANGTLFFAARDLATGNEFWKSDGTTAGTVLVADLNPGPLVSNPGYWTYANGAFLFTADDGVNGRELWRTDGTTAGTTLVKDINSGASSVARDLVNVNGTVVLIADDGTTGTELWKTDGTTAGTVLVKDIRPGTAGQAPSKLTNVNGTLFFNANDGTNGTELWKSDGTTAGTVMVKDIRPGALGSSPNYLVNVNGTLFFSAVTDTSGAEVWMSDGTTAGTVLVEDINPSTSGANSPVFLTNVDGKLFFRGYDGTNGGELWVMAPTPPRKTGLVRDVATGLTPSNISSMVNVNGTLFFKGYDADRGYELWKSDGTEAGTVIVKDIYPGVGTGTLGWLTNVNGTLFFSANSGGHNVDLWKSDGTEAGTVRVAVISEIPNEGSDPRYLTNVNGTLFFTADNGVTGAELWKSDGTAAGTVLVKEVRPGTDPNFMAGLTNVNGTLFFTAFDETYAQELWKSDGTTAGTVIVKDINAGYAGSYPRELTNVNGTLFFQAGSAGLGAELWKSDGTDAGTVMVKDIRPGIFSSTPQFLTNVNGTLFFRAGNNSGGPGYYQLWKSDGTDAGTVLVKDVDPGNRNTHPTALVNVNGTLYFSAYDDATGYELWKSDGTTAGTVLVKDINPGAAYGLPAALTNVNGTLFFRADDGVNGVNLWKSDGTEAGTIMILDIAPGAGDSSPRYMTNVDGTLYFRADDGVHGNELWAVVPERVAPVVTGVTSGTANGAYSVGSSISIQVMFDEAVNVVGTPTLTLDSGGTASYTGGTGTNTLTFTYTVGSGHTSADLDYTSTSALSLNGGAIRDAVGNAAPLTLATPGTAGSLSDANDIAIDTTAPTVTGVTSSTGTGAYGVGATISIQVVFDEAVLVMGTPTLTLNSGGTASFSSGSGTNTLTFEYTVGGGNTSNDLDYTSTSALSVSGGSIADAATNGATLTLAAPGNAGSLGFASDIVIDSTPPDTSFTDTPSNPTSDNTPTFQFSGDDGSGSGVASFEVKVDGGSFTAATSPFTTDPLSDGSHTIEVRALDAAGNFDPTPASFTFVVDTTAPDSSVNSLPASVVNASFQVSWSGTDNESGIASYDVFVSVNGGAATLWLDDTTATSAIYPGSVGNTYAFYTVATDNVGNVEMVPATPDTSTTVNSGNVTLRANGGNLEIVDNGSSTVVHTQALTDPTPINLWGSSPLDHLTLDFASGGAFSAAAPINFNGSGLAGITILGDGASTGSFTSGGSAGSGTFNIGGTSINVTNSGAQAVSGLSSFSVNTTGGDDSLTVSNPTAGASQINGTSGGVVLAPFTFFDIGSLTIDTSTNDTAASTDSITMSAGAIHASGLQNLTVAGGAGTDTLSVPTASMILPVGGGTFTFNGGADTDRVVVSGNVNMTLTNSLLVADTATLMLSSVEAASLTGGASANVLDASAFTGDVEFTGGAGNDTFTGGSGSDTLVETGNVNFTLTNATLTGLGTDTFTSIEKARLTGGVGNNTINASAFGGSVVLEGGSGNDKLTGGIGNDTLIGGAGTNTLTGGGGTDTVTETGDVNFTLTNTKLTGPGSDTLSGIELVELTGGEGNNIFTVSGATLPTTLHGGGGVDRVASINDTNFTLTDAALTRSAGGTFTLDSIEEANLAGGASDNILDASAFSGSAILNGGAGNDTLIGGSGDDTLTGGLGDDTLNGGGGINTVSDVGDVNFTLTDTTLTGLGTDTLTNIAKAAIAGGTSANILNAAAFTGEVSLTGGAGNDTLIGGSGTNHVVETGVTAATLLDGQLKIGSATDTLVGITDAILIGTKSGNTFTVTGWTGTATLDGGVGTDKVVAVNDADFTLTNTTLTRSTGGTFNIVEIESATLTGGATANTFDLSGWTGIATLMGGGGADQLISNNNAGDLTLTNTTVTRTTGGKITFTAIPGVTVGGDGAANVFTVSARTADSTTLIGGGGNDRVVSVTKGNATLTDSDLSRTVGTATMTYNLQEIEEATLAGGTGNDTLDASAFAGNVTFTGGTGNDVMVGGSGANVAVEPGNVNFTLAGSTTSATLTGLGTDTLLNIGEVRLTGGSSANTLNASGYSGSTILDGGNGNDTLTGGSGFNILVGNVGNDILNAGAGRDVLIGGAGVDQLNGGSGDNILIGGTVNYGITTPAFGSIVAEWQSGNSYSQRVSFLRFGGGLNGTNVLDATTAPNDSAVDTLTGGQGTDWFILNEPQDAITDLLTPEVTN